MSASTGEFMIDDWVCAWVPHGKFVISGAVGGSLEGLSFAVKDVFDVAGYPTGFGNPVWLQTHDVATETAPIVQRLLDAGAKLAGKVITDELTYSLNGDNIHYGTPVNPVAPDCVPGGSSSGSASAVAAGLVDFSLGTDTGGSTRVPASYCGLWGLRTTHGSMSAEGVLPLQPSFDTVTWFAKDPVIFERVSQTLLPDGQFHFSKLAHIEPLWTLADTDIQEGLATVERVVATLIDVSPMDESLLQDGESFETWRHLFHIASAHQAWQVHGAWIEQHGSNMAEPILKRFQFAQSLTDEQATVAWQSLKGISRRVRAVLGSNGVLVLPSSATTALSKTLSPAQVDDARMRTMRITCVAGIAGLPQVSIPMCTNEGLVYGVSLLGPPGSDLSLIKLAGQVAELLTTIKKGEP